MSEEENLTHPIQKRPRYELPNTAHSFWWLGGWWFMGVVMLAAGSRLIGLMLAMIGVAGALRYKSGIGWAIALRSIRNRITRSKRGDILVRNFSDTAFVQDGLKHRTTGYAPPRTLEQLPLQDPQGRTAQLGIIHNPDSRYDTILLASAGWSSAVNADPLTRIYHDARWVQAMKTAANETGSLPHLTATVLRRPASAESQLDFLTKRMSQDASEATIRNLDEAIGYHYGNGADFYLVFTISAARPRAWKRPLSELDEHVIRRAPLMRVYKALETALVSAGMDRVRPVSYFDTNTTLHALFDVVDLPEFMRDVAHDKELDRERRITRLDEAATLQRGPWPESIRATQDAILTDRTWHTSLWASSFDYDAVPVDFFDTLFASLPGWYTISLGLETQPRDKARRSSKVKRKVFRVVDRSGVAGGVVEPEDIDQRNRAENEAWAIFRSGSNTARYRLSVTVSASSYEELEWQVEEVLGMFRSHGVRLTRYMGEYQQLPALLAPMGIAL